MKMEFVIVMNRSVFLTGIIYRWNILTILAAIYIPYLASHETGVVVKNSLVNIIKTSRNITSGNVNTTSTNTKEGTGDPVNVNNWIFPGNESRDTTKVSDNKASNILEESLQSESIVKVNKTSTNHKKGTSDVAEVKVNNSQVNLSEGSRRTTKINVKKMATNSSESANRFTGFNVTTGSRPRSRNMASVAVNNSNSQSRHVTEVTVNASRAGPDDHSGKVTFWTSADEGSAHGSLSDALGMSDDEDDEDEDSADINTGDGAAGEARGADGLEDDGGGGVDEAASAMIDEVNDSILVTCFRCHGDGINGCDVTTMVRNADAYSVICSGKCLNVSSGSTAVYDCAHDMQTHTDTCLQNDDTKICFCTGSFCNGPFDPSDLNVSTSHLYPNHLLPLDVEDYDNEITNSSDIILTMDAVLMNKSTAESPGKTINNSNIGHENNESSIDFKKQEPPFHSRNHVIDNKNGTSSYLSDLFTDNNTHIFQDIWPQFKQSYNENINYIIPDNNSDSYNNSVGSDALSPNAIYIGDLRVGKLKDSLGEGVSKNCQPTVNVYSVLLPGMVSSLLTLLAVL